MKLIEPGFFKRNKKLILISVAIMIICVVASAIYTYIAVGDSYGQISRALLQQKNHVDPTSINVSGIGIFLHNLYANFLMILGGFVFSIFSVIAVILNGISIGSPFGYDFNYACATILPHAILEYFATSLSLVIALKITSIEIDVIKKRNLRKEHHIDLKDILVLIIVDIVLLFIAAMIEGYVTPLVLKISFGL